jgi:arabinan endo-1,5-alpha-L-arabinosidase
MRRFAVTVAIATLLVQFGMVAATAAEPPDPVAAASTYTNPVSASFSRNFADPAVIRGRDGYWYGYATNGRRTAGDERHLMMIARSADLVHWDYVGDVFNQQTMPRYDGRPETVNRQFWAPSIKYFGGRYLLYYSYVVNDGADQMWRAIGVATADHPAGPWTDSGSPRDRSGDLGTAARQNGLAERDRPGRVHRARWPALPVLRLGARRGSGGRVVRRRAACGRRTDPTHAREPL